MKKKRRTKSPPPPAEAAPSHAAGAFVFSWRKIAQASLIAAALFWIYSPVFHGQWLWDDDLLITENPLLKSWAGLEVVWFRPTLLLDYQPIKVTVEWIEWQLWGTNTLGYHLLTLVLHFTGCLLIWRLFSRLGLRLAWLGGLIFAIHPLNVESVAWISELKNTLSLPPFLLAMFFYMDYDAHGRRRDYFAALALFLVAMLCKTSMAMFPFIILLYAWWKRDRIAWKDGLASAPFFGISLALGLITIWFMQLHTLDDEAITLGGPLSRLALAGLSLAFYVTQFFLPLHLTPIHPQWPIIPPRPLQFIPWLIVGGVAWILWIKRQGWGRAVLFGLGFFFITLLPFIGFTPGTYMNFTWVMDHIVYIPIIGLIGVVVAGCGQLAERLPRSTRWVGAGILGAILVLLACASHGYAKLYTNPVVLWEYAIQRAPQSWMAHDNLGSALLKDNQIDPALEQFDQVLALNPDEIRAHLNRGIVLNRKGRHDEALTEFREVLRIKPHLLADALTKASRLSAALHEFAETIKDRPTYVEAHDNWGNPLMNAGRVDEALQQLTLASQLDPTSPEAHYNLGAALIQAGRVDEAIQQDEQAIHLRPSYAEAHQNLGVALVQAGRVAEARQQYELALQIQPDFAQARYNLGTILLQGGQVQEAIDQFTQALQFLPDNPEIHNNLGVALIQAGRAAEARTQFETALKLAPDYAAAHENLDHLQAPAKGASSK